MIWLLRVTLAGRTWYLASESCAPEEDGVAIPHHGTLSVSGFGEGIEWAGGGITGPCTADVNFHLSDLDGWELYRDGHRLESARAELALWTPGTTYAARWVLITGTIEGAAIPIDGEPIDATVTDRVIETAEAWPPADDTITATAWPNAPDDDETFSVLGEPYPWPLGTGGPYITDADTSRRTSVSPVIIVDDTAAAEVGVVAGAPVAATTVKIWNDTTRDAADFSVSTTADGDGIRRATVSFAAAPAGWVFDGTHKLYVTNWNEGGLMQDRSASAVLGLGDAILYLLSRRYDATGSERIDRGAWLAALPYLNVWRVFLNVESGDPLDVIKNDLLPLCPGLYLLGGPRGIRPVILRTDPAAPVIRLEVGRDLDVTDEPPGFVEIEPVNEIAVSFAYSLSRGDYRATATISADALPHARASASRHGRRAEALEARAVYGRGVAELAARSAILLRWTRPLYLVYSCTGEAARQIELGQRVSLTDADRGLADRLCYVIAREAGEDGDDWEVTLAGLW